MLARANSATAFSHTSLHTGSVQESQLCARRRHAAAAALLLLEGHGTAEISFVKHASVLDTSRAPHGAVPA